MIKLVGGFKDDGFLTFHKFDTFTMPFLSVGVKICEKHRDEQIAKIPAGFVGVFIPSCKVNGDYEEIQCHGSSGYCWCVDDNGNELPGTRTRHEPNCTNSGRVIAIG